jgi:DNA-binding GntR family transcriptional regulator
MAAGTCLDLPTYGDHVERIDHDAGEPVWSQLAGILRGQIQRGEIAPGKLLPSTRTLMQTYGVADGTVKRAISKLREEQLVKSVPGRGVYVAER